MTSITDLPPEMIDQIILRSNTLDRVYIRGVCYTWNQLTDKRLPPDLLQTLRQLTKLAADVDTTEHDIDKLTAQISQLNVVQDNITTVSTVANVLSVSAAVFHGCPIVVKAVQEHNAACEEHLRRYLEQHPEHRTNDDCAIL